MSDLLTVPALADIILRKEALAAGYTDRNLAQLVGSGELVKVRHGAYTAGPRWRSLGDAEQHMVRSRAVLKQASTDLVISHTSALPEYDGPMWGVPLDVVHATRKDGKAGRKEAGVRQHQGVLLPDDVVVRNGIETTSATRAAIDVTTVVGTEAALVMVNHLLHHGHTTLDAVRKRYEPMARNPFTLSTDLVLRLADGRIESVGESRTFFLMWRNGVPRPEPQFVVEDQAGHVVARLDFAWPERKRWLEFDGKEKYVKHLREGETVTDVVLREKRREEQVCELTGWRCIRITCADLCDPARLVSRILAFLN